MTLSSAISFALGGSATAALGATTLLPLVAGNNHDVSIFAAAGFLAMAIPGIACGIWLAHEHGRPGSGFLLAIASGFATRLILAAVLAILAARVAAGPALIAGLAAGFVPLTAFEMIWFVRRHPRSLRAEPRG